MPPRTARPAGWFPIRAKFRCRCRTAPLRTSRATEPTGPLDVTVFSPLWFRTMPSPEEDGARSTWGAERRTTLEGGRTLVRRPDADVSGLRRQLHLLRGRAALLRGEGAAERAPALSELPRDAKRVRMGGPREYHAAVATRAATRRWCPSRRATIGRSTAAPASTRCAPASSSRRRPRFLTERARP